MTPEQFCYWLQGFFELSCPIDGLSPTQIAMIRDHLDLVFTKVTPDRSKKQVLLSEKTDGQKFQEVLEELKVDPFSRPDTYCVPTGKGRIC